MTFGELEDLYMGNYVSYIEFMNLVDKVRTIMFKIRLRNRYISFIINHSRDIKIKFISLPFNMKEESDFVINVIEKDKLRIVLTKENFTLPEYSLGDNFAETVIKKLIPAIVNSLQLKQEAHKSLNSFL